MAIYENFRLVLVAANFMFLSAHGATAATGCAEIAELIANRQATQRSATSKDQWRRELNCAAARGLPEGVIPELMRSNWNPMLKRWEFTLRCARAEDCVPFMVWAQLPEPAGRAMRAAPESAASGSAAFKDKNKDNDRNEKDKVPLVERGQTAILTWDEGGIRIVLPVTCLEPGALGDFVLVRLQTVQRTLRAEVMGAGELRASL